MRVMLFAAAALLLEATASADTLAFNNVTYTLGSSETITVPFTSVSGIQSASTYSGFIRLVVSGTGSGAYGGTPNDAFYVSPYRTTDVATCGYLKVDTVALGGGCGPANRATPNQIVYSIDDNRYVSAAGGSYTPNVQASTHRYQFVINVNTLLALHSQLTGQRLWFASSDGNYGDNTGSYSVQVTQLLAASPVPEPAGMAMFAIGLGSLMCMARGRRVRLPSRDAELVQTHVARLDR